MRLLVIRNRNPILLLIKFTGLLFVVLSIWGIISLLVVLPVAAGLDADFNEVFRILGVPFTLIMTLVWLYRNYTLVKEMMGR
jgi:succinate dehydrogenase hydrophobic anchor subunit